MDWSEFLTAVEQVSAVATLPGAVIVASALLGAALVASVALLCGTFLLWRVFSHGPRRDRVPERVPPAAVDWTPLIRLWRFAFGVLSALFRRRGASAAGSVPPGPRA